MQIIPLSNPQPETTFPCPVLNPTHSINKPLRHIHPPFPTITQFFSYFSMTQPKCTVLGTSWRLTDRVVGHIQGLPASHGMLLATDGILCYIDQGAERTVQPYLGHVGWFVPDDKEVDMHYVIQNRMKPESVSEIAVRILQEMSELGY